MPGDFLSKLSIRWILPVAVVTPVIVVAGVLTYIAYQTGQRSANELAEQNIRQIHARIEGHLNRLMELPPAINRLNLTRLHSGILALDDPAGSRELVFQTLDIFPDVSSIVLGCAKGQNMWVIRYPGETSYEYALKPSPDAPMQEFAMGSDGKVNPQALSSFKFDPTQRPWYRAAIEADGSTWGNVYVWVRGGKGVTLGVPYVEPYRNASGEILGVVCCELTLSDISHFLKRLEVGKTGMAFIIERDGNLVATSTGMDCLKDGTSRLPATEAPDRRIVDAVQKLRNSEKLGDLRSIEARHAQVAGVDMQLVVSPYQNRRNLDWLVVTLVPDQDFLADINRARTRSLIIGTAATALALLAGLFMAKWLVAPVLAVVAHARRVGGGELDARLTRKDYREIEQISTAINEMADGLQDRLRMRHALSLAMEVQQSLLPLSTPKVQGLDVAARSKYCDETGGDYYDYINVEGIGNDSLAVALGDVMGHGIAAAMMMATARGVLRSQARTQGSLGKLLTHLNQHIVADTKGDRFMTMFLAVIDVPTMTMRWASAGHDQPIIYDPSAGTITEIDPLGPGVPLGVMDDEDYQELSYSNLRPGQVMLIGTDGLWESTNDAGEEFGKDRVGRVLAELSHLSAAEIESGMYRRLQEFCSGKANADDITYLVIKFV